MGVQDVTAKVIFDGSGKEDVTVVSILLYTREEWHLHCTHTCANTEHIQYYA